MRQSIHTFSSARRFRLRYFAYLFILQLTCATQITGWQPADGHNFPMYQQNNEVMELSRIISQLAMANHQLASAHNATLARMEALYLELSKDRQDRKQKISTEPSEMLDDTLRKRLSDPEGAIEREETRRLEQRVVRLERLLAASSAEQCKQRDDSKLRSRIERLESLLKTRDTKNRSRSVESRCESSEQQTSDIAIDAVSEVPEDDCGDNQGAREEMVDIYRYCNDSDDSEITVPRIKENSDSASIDKMRRRRARLRDDEQSSTTKNPAGEEIVRLSEEVERLKADRLEYQSANERLLCSLADQKTLMEKLNEDYEV